MKFYQAGVMWILAGSIIFSQQPVKGAGGSNGSSAAPTGVSDAGATGNLQVKSNQQIIHDNPQLAQKMQALLPPEITPEQACNGYKTFDQCLSAIHLAREINISFNTLKVETTGKHASGLEKAAERLAPMVNAKDAVKAARRAASDEMKGISLFG